MMIESSKRDAGERTYKIARVSAPHPFNEAPSTKHRFRFRPGGASRLCRPHCSSREVTDP